MVLPDNVGEASAPPKEGPSLAKIYSPGKYLKRLPGAFLKLNTADH